MAERRLFPRVKRRYLVQFKSAGRVCSGFTHNLSPMGLFVCSVHLPKPGTPLCLRVRIPGETNFVLQVSVVRSYKVPQHLTRFVPSGFCVRFQQAPEEYFRLIARLLHVAA